MSDHGTAQARQRARELLVRALYQWQLAQHERGELLRQFEATPEYARIDKSYFKDLLAAVLDDVEALDALIGKFAARGVEHLDAVGRAVLLLGLAELRHRADVPTKVIINEAVDLAKRYGAADSYRFVNAVLDKAAREMLGRGGASQGEGGQRRPST